MTLVQAPTLGIARYANDRHKESWSHASDNDKNVIIRAVYRQVLGQQYVMDNERQSGAESLFKDGALSVREFVRTVANSGLYRARFFDNCNAYRFIELNFKHLLGRAPQNKAEMLHHFTILQQHGVEAEIDSYIDSAEYQERFGQDVVPYLHGWDYSKGHQGRQFSWLMQLAAGAAASVKGDRSGIQAALNRPLHQNQPVAVRGAAGAVIIRNVSVRRDYSGISTDGPFRALISDQAGLYGGETPGAAPRSASQDHRQEALRVSPALRGTNTSGARLVTIKATGIVDNAYVRSGSYVLRVPFSRMNEALQRVSRLGGRVIDVVVN